MQHACGGGRVHMGNPVLSSQLCCEYKTVQKIKSIKNKQTNQQTGSLMDIKPGEKVEAERQVGKL